MKPIHEYLDYIDYLKEFYQYKKSTNNHFNYSVWAKKMELKSASVLTMILNGSRYPSNELVNKLAHYIGLSEEERKYLDSLVNFKKIKNKTHINIELIKPEINSSPKEYESFLIPLLFMLREILTANLRTELIDIQFLKKQLLLDFKDDEVQYLINKLVEEKLINLTENTNDNVSENHNFFASSDEVFKFHKSTLSLTEKAFFTCSRESRSFHTSYVKVKLAKLNEARELLAKFQREFSELCEESSHEMLEETRDEAWQLYQVNLHLFPVSKPFNLQ